MLPLPSGREMADLAVEAGAIDMAQGVVHTSPPPLFLSLLKQHFANRHMHVYASPVGYKQYRQALLKLLKRERSDLTLGSIMATNGTTGGLVSALRSRCKPLDHVALFEPFYPAHDWAIQSLHNVSQYIPYTTDFNIDWNKTTKALKTVSAFVLANPANPTGLLINSDDLLRLYSLCQQYNVLLIVDEVYQDFIWEGQFDSLLSLAENLDHLVILRSFSKNLALAGWRAGYTITTPARRAQMTHIHDAIYVGAPTAPQYILADMLAEHLDVIDNFISHTIDQYRQNRQMVIEAFTTFGMEPLPKQGAYYMMVKHNRTSDMAAMKELLKLGIAVAPGAPFYKPGTTNTGYIRIHFALSPSDCVKVRSILTVNAVSHQTALKKRQRRHHTA